METINCNCVFFIPNDSVSVKNDGVLNEGVYGARCLQQGSCASDRKGYITHTHTQTHTLSLSHTNTHTHLYTLTYTLTLIHAHGQAHTLSHTHVLGLGSHRNEQNPNITSTN